MKKILLIPILLILALPVSAAPKTDFTLPERAVEVSQGVFSLGSAKDPGTGKIVEGIAILHPRNEKAKGASAGKKPGGGSSTCYAFISSGAKWKVKEDWVLNGANSHGLTPEFIFNNTALNITKWENAAGQDIFGNGMLVNTLLSADENSPDGVNEVYFGEIESSGTIAVTIVWGIFSGPARNRQIVEWDQIFDDSSFSWANDANASDMDFENISTHEIGHALGMGHPSDSCTGETMYRFASEGETDKRTLNAGDISGIQNLY